MSDVCVRERRVVGQAMRQGIPCCCVCSIVVRLLTHITCSRSRVPPCTCVLLPGDCASGACALTTSQVAKLKSLLQRAEEKEARLEQLKRSGGAAGAKAVKDELWRDTLKQATGEVRKRVTDWLKTPTRYTLKHATGEVRKQRAHAALLVAPEGI